MLYALGGSTNGVLHLLALAQEAQVPLTIQVGCSPSPPVPYALARALPACGQRRVGRAKVPLLSHRTVRTPAHLHQDIDEIGARVPLLANLAPAGKYNMVRLQWQSWLAMHTRAL